MATLEDVQTWRGREAVGPDGEKIGKIDDIYLDRQTGDPEWAAVKTGLFGMNVSFVPLEGASATDDAVRLNHDKATVKDAPNVDPEGELSPEEERRLYDHYGRDFGDWDDSTEDRAEGVPGRDERVGRGDRFDADADPDRDDDGRGLTDSDAMTRSEEELRVGTTRHETGRARLRKFVVTEPVETTIPVQREEVRIDREPITGDNRDAAMGGPEISKAEHEVTLHGEEPVVEKEVVPKERVRLGMDTVTEERSVSDEVRKERVEPEGDDDVSRERL